MTESQAWAILSRQDRDSSRGPLRNRPSPLKSSVAASSNRPLRRAFCNAEILFVWPDLLHAIFAPRPHVGVMINSDGKNSYAYAGPTWTGTFLRDLASQGDRVFAALGLGGAIHDGPDISFTEDHKGLGTRLLFHKSAQLGYRIDARWSASIFLDHVSNADIGERNPGLTDLGLRAGYKF